MALKIETTTSTNVIFGNMTLCKGSIYIVRLSDGKEEIGEFTGFSMGYVGFKTLLGNKARNYMPKNIVEVVALDNLER